MITEEEFIKIMGNAGFNINSIGKYHDFKVVWNNTRQEEYFFNYDDKTPIHNVLLKKLEETKIRNMILEDLSVDYSKLIKEIEKRINHINHAEIMRDDEKIQLRLLNELLGV